MDSNTPEKKPKRPRIGQTFHAPEEGSERPRYDRPYNPTPRVDTGAAENQTEGDSYRQQRPYQQRPQGGYQQRQGGYNNYNNNRPYQQRRYDNNNTGSQTGEGGYQPRQQPDRSGNCSSESGYYKS